MEYNNELMHYGVKGMKWGVRRNRGISGTIRDVQRNRAVKDLAKVNSQQRQVKRELGELRGYDRNPSKIGKSKISTAIRRSQIRSLEKTQNKLNSREKDNKSAIKELDQIERYQAKKHADKAVNSFKQKTISKGKKALENLLTYQIPADRKRQPWDEKPGDPTVVGRRPSLKDERNKKRPNF